MRITLLGHASLVVEAPGATLFMDPVFSDPFQGGLVQSCPSRVVHVDKLPRPDAIFLSHNHLDHYHSPSLRSLSRSLPVYIPKDATLLRMLSQDGFHNVHTVAPWERIQLGQLTATVTPSTSHFAEVGLLLDDGTTTAWNQVDTVITQRTCMEVQRLCPGGLDVAFTGYRPLLEHASMWREDVEFPQERYERMLEMALCTRARTVIPGSAGLRCTDENAWANHRLFPGSREQFIKDLHSVAPEQATLLLFPGQAVTPQQGDAPLVEETPYATTVEKDEHRVSFQPGRYKAPLLEDGNPHRFPETVLDTTVQALVGARLQGALRDALAKGVTGPLQTMWCRRSSFQVDVVFPSRVRSWNVAQWVPQPVLEEGALKGVDYRFTYVASELHAYVRGLRPEIPRIAAYCRPNPNKKSGKGFRFGTLSPARLHGVDAYLSVDDTYTWNPLALLDR